MGIRPNRIFAMAAQPDGRQIIGGTFTSYAGNAINRLARITRTGAFDNTFNIGVGPNGQVNAIAVDASGRILIGGSFSMYNNVQRARLARLNSDGTLDATFTIGTGMAGGVVNAIAVQADGKIIV
ncbi:MAG TPA: delta-60 repeat domain-containing protein, partial [Flavobacteriales bacterium]|nr:delta-60 repeat domain-containing protein [Flavobacteriales bacterium]